MAMTRIAPRSSTMASATRNTFRASGIRFPRRLIIPREKAISVAMGMPQPCRTPGIPVKETTARKIRAGKTMPPRAPKGGQGRFLAGTQLPGDKLPLDLQPNHVKKDGHERIVDKMQQMHLKFEAPHFNGQRGVP